jgi:predicted nuclease of predicted toxin-antitoxin system
MRFIVDAQLPVRLARFLNQQGYDTLHTKDLPLHNATPDAAINNLSVQEQRVVVTKDADFVESFLLRQIPYKLLLVSTGNIKNSELELLFQDNIQQLVDLLENHSYIELGRDAIIVHQ